LFSILKMGRYIAESSQLLQALRASRPKITVFLFTILFIVVIVGSMMYIIEGPENGFDNIPESMYWAVVTVSTVGYGDISPQTPVGKLLSSLLMIIAYGILAVPTGIISYELAQTSKLKKKIEVRRKVCRNCSFESYSEDDRFCSKCGASL
jgi:voltage-gated potassium channel